MTRHWIATRQTYTPPRWHSYLLGLIITVTTYVIFGSLMWWLLGLHMLLVIVCSLVSAVLGGVLGPEIVYWRWERKHPVLLPEVLAQQARWN